MSGLEILLWMVTHAPDGGSPIAGQEDLDEATAQAIVDDLNRAQERKPHKHWYDMFSYIPGQKIAEARRRKVIPYWSPDEHD